MNTHTVDTNIKAPSKLLALTELPRALTEFAALQMTVPFLMAGPRGDGHPVLVLPGFVTTDGSTSILRAYLRHLGYDVYGWELGRNLGPKAIGPKGEKLIERLRTIHANTGRKVSVVGWSLGGVMARQVSRRLPDAVRQVITLGSPFTGDPRASTVWKLYERLTGQKVKDADTQAQLSESRLPPPVPSTAIFSRNDGIVAWQNCLEDASDMTDNIEVRGSHTGLGVNPLVLHVIADKLAQREGEWHRFEPGWLTRWAFPQNSSVH